MKKKKLRFIITFIIVVVLITSILVISTINKKNSIKENDTEVEESIPIAKQEELQVNKYYSISKKSYKEIEESRDKIIEEVDKLNELNGIEYFTQTSSFSIADGDYFCYENKDENLKTGYSFWRYKIVINYSESKSNDLMEIEYKIDKDCYPNKEINIEEIGILAYGDTILGKTDRNIKDINEKINNFIFNEEKESYSIDIDYKNENGRDRLTVYEDRLEYTVLSSDRELVNN